MDVNFLIKDFIVDDFLFGEKDGFTDDTSLMDSGFIDSTGMLELMTFLEQKFQIEFDDEDLTMEFFESVNTISKMVKIKINGSSPN